MNMIQTFEALKKAEELRQDAENNFLSTFGTNVRNKREGLDLKQEELARMIGLGRTSITNIESGRQDIPITRLMILCVALKCNPSELLPDIL